MTGRPLGPTCVVYSCLRPARAQGGYCVNHWWELSASQRLAVQGRRADTEPLDPRAVAECCALEDLWDAPAYGEGA